ncbi:hypothetical protein GQ55_7G140100 [Panicum hallii var. hallii]|uniref:Uncharacterized protein n=1 Tax=Panicum hallii var. hallii TaxID=1504633 RepID=A0A2T7CUY3_9POAL|nr:hypothetical protein GQ55_7G140100 [Panicum hallii var. hallii]
MVQNVKTEVRDCFQRPILFGNPNGRWLLTCKSANCVLPDGNCHSYLTLTSNHSNYSRPLSTAPILWIGVGAEISTSILRNAFESEGMISKWPA